MKLLSISILFTLLISVFLTLDTNASYSDREESNGNHISAATLDMSVRDTSGAQVPTLFTLDDAKPGDSQERTIVIARDGSQNFTYRLRMDGMSVSPSLCNAITLSVKNGLTSVYSGDLAGFTSTPTSHSAGSNAWTFGVHIDDDAVMDAECDFSLRADAWQAGSAGLWGLSDTESVADPIKTKTWVVVSFDKHTDTHTVSFSVTNIEDYTKIDYIITYSGDGEDRGIVGSQDLSNTHAFDKHGIFLGSCTSGGTCTPDTGVTGLKLTVDLTESGGAIQSFEKSL